tara:strand:+ start:630 stop:809 length:180 start_codon:yes stop_codon:yes gene_type:complete
LSHKPLHFLQFAVTPVSRVDTRVALLNAIAAALSARDALMPAIRYAYSKSSQMFKEDTG